MAEKLTNSVICPVCKNSFEINGEILRCPVCGHTASAEALVEKTRKASLVNDVAVYRLMAAADTYFRLQLCARKRQEFSQSIFQT